MYVQYVWPSALRAAGDASFLIRGDHLPATIGEVGFVDEDGAEVSAALRTEHCVERIAYGVLDTSRLPPGRLRVVALDGMPVPDCDAELVVWPAVTSSRLVPPEEYGLQTSSCWLPIDDGLVLAAETAVDFETFSLRLHEPAMLVFCYEGWYPSASWDGTWDREASSETCSVRWNEEAVDDTLRVSALVRLPEADGSFAGLYWHCTFMIADGDASHALEFLCRVERWVR